MSTNIALLPQLGIPVLDVNGSFTGVYAPAQFSVATNADWRDVISFFLADGVTPVDLTGINFDFALRSSPIDPNLLLTGGTSNGLLINTNGVGQLKWAVPGLQVSTDINYMGRLTGFQQGVMDLVASADGQRINLFQYAGPAIVTIQSGVLR